MKKFVCTVCGYVQTGELDFSPETGDGCRLWMWTARGGASCAAFAILLLLKKRRTLV